MTDLNNTLGGSAGFGENSLSRNDDGSFQLNITSVFESGINFFGTNYTSLFINTNGNVTFGSAQSTYTPAGMAGVTRPMIAPFFADVDTRGGAVTASSGGTSTGSNLIWYDLDTVNDVITITWDDVGYYNAKTNKLNAFQMELIDLGGGDWTVRFVYESINWTTGDASGGSNGLGGTVATAGFTAGNGVDFYQLPTSGSQAAMLDLDLNNGNQGEQAVWEFLSDGGTVFDIAMSANSVQEFAAGGTVVGTLSSAAVGAGATFSLVDSAGGRFVIVGNQVRVADGILLDFEQRQTETITVRVFDGAASADFNLVINVSNVEPEIINAGNAGYTIVGGGVADTITTGTGADTINGGAGDDTLSSGAGNDTLDGGTGTDTMTGGLGNDIYFVDNAGDAVVELSSNAGTDLVNSTVTFSAAGTNQSGVENITLTGTANINATGNALNNVLTGNAGNNVLDGGAGADTLIGGVGDETYYVDNVGDVVNELAGNAGTDIVFSTVTFSASGANQSGIENITLTGATNINATGNNLNNIIIGNTGNNVLTGGNGDDRLTGNAGSDWLIGGANADRFVYDTHMMSGQYDVISDFSVAEGDRIDLSTFGPASWAVLQGHLLFVDGANNAHLAGKWNGTDQHLTLSGINVGTLSAAQFVFDTSATARNITGTANEDRIFGGLGNDTITAGGGHDRIFGDAGDDIIYGEGGNDRIFGHAGADTVYGGDGNDQIYGGDGNDTLDAGSGNNHLDGEAGDDTLIGGSGNDNIIGGTGADIMTGGAGADIYNVDNVGDVVNESASNAGRDWVFTTVSFNLGGTAAGVENATLEGTADINLTGNALANSLFGNSGSNVLDGGDGNDTLNGGDGNDTLIGGAGNDRLAGDAGADTMTGGSGNYIYEVDNVGDIVNEAVGDGGTDTVNTSISFSLTGTAAGVEKGTLLGSAHLNLTGNGLANTLTGNVGNNILDGGDGNDRLIGGDGNDTLIGGNGLDTLEGGGGADTISGGAGNDRIFGGAGDDVINGGTGNDALFGETGADTFVFEAAFGRDTISGFNAAEDKLDLTDFGVDSAAELMPYATNSGAHMLITMSTGNVITIQNFSVAQVHNGMFVV